MAPSRRVTRKCVFCSKSMDRSDMIRVTTNADERSNWIRRLGNQFKENCTKVSTPFICLCHFPLKKAQNPRKNVLPYKGGYLKQNVVYDEESLEGNDNVVESEDDGSDEESDWLDSGDCGENDYETLNKSDELQNILVGWNQLLPIISICFACLKNGTKNYANITTHQRGAAVKAVMNCSRCAHKWTWFSSSVCDRPNEKGPKQYSVNQWITTAVTITGNGYTKMRGLFKALQMPFLCENRFYEIVKEYVKPAIEETYSRSISSALSKVCESISTNGPLNLAGDGQYDSRGYSAYVCRFSLMDIATKFILDFQVCRKQRGGNSNALEKEAHKIAFPRLSSELRSRSNVAQPIRSLTTDRCTNLSASMKEFPNVLHYFDAWHWIRSIRKDIAIKEEQVQFRPIKHWVRPLINHVHASICSSNGDGALAFEKILSFFHHCRNIHSNFQPIRNTNFNSFTECDHAISPNAPSTSKHIDLNVPSDLRAYNVLLNIVTKPKRQEDLKSVSPHYATSALESFHSLALYYLPKEKFYDHDSYVLRSKLAILHWNSLRSEELEGTRTIKSQIPFWCKTKKQIVFKNRKTEGRHDWRKTIVELVLNSEATTSPHNQQQSEVDARADAESRMYQS